MTKKYTDTIILSQSYNASVFLSSACIKPIITLIRMFYQSIILPPFFNNMFPTKPFYGRRVVEQNEMHGDVPVSDTRHAFRAS